LPSDPDRAARAQPLDRAVGELLVIQAIIAGIVSVPFFFRNRLRSVFGWLRRASAKVDEPSTEPHEAE
jgi:hypothetical protein